MTKKSIETIKNNMNALQPLLKEKGTIWKGVHIGDAHALPQAQHASYMDELRVEKIERCSISLVH